MQLNQKIVILALAIILIAAAVFIYFQFKTKVPGVTTEQLPGKSTVEESSQPPSATGNVDDIIASVLQDANNDSAAAQQDAPDSTALNTDTQAVSDFGQSYDETQF